MKKYNEFTNESLRDKMTPVTEEDIRKKLGEEEYHIYKSLEDAKESIKPPFKFTDNYKLDKKGVHSFGIELWFLRFEIHYDGENWVVVSHYTGERVSDPLNDWKMTYEHIIESTKSYLSKEIKVVQKDVDRKQEKIDDLGKIISELT